MAKKIKCFLPRTVPLFVLIIFLLTIRMIQAGMETPPKPADKGEVVNQENPTAEGPVVEPVATIPQVTVPEAKPAPAETSPTPPAPIVAVQPAPEQTPSAEVVPAVVTSPPEEKPAAFVAPVDQPVTPPAAEISSDNPVAKSDTEKVKEKDVKEVAAESKTSEAPKEAAPAEAAPAETAPAEPAPAPTPAPTSMEYQGVYKSGNAPLKEKTKVRIYRSGDAYFFAHREESGSWSVPLESIRGAQATEKGLWFYWFDATDNTLSAHFEVPLSPQQLASEINAATAEFNEKNSGAAYKQRYEEYKQKALQDSK